jgi:hypothetical protein
MIIIHVEPARGKLYTQRFGSHLVVDHVKINKKLYDKFSIDLCLPRVFTTVVFNIVAFPAHPPDGWLKVWTVPLI